MHTINVTKAGVTIGTRTQINDTVKVLLFGQENYIPAPQGGGKAAVHVSLADGGVLVTTHFSMKDVIGAQQTQSFQLMADGSMLVRLTLETDGGSAAHALVYNRTEVSPFEGAPPIS